MKLPNAEHAIILDAKVRDYLLSRVHPVGRFKAAFYAALGDEEDDWPRLEADLRGQHLSQDAVLGELTDFGQKYEIRAPLRGPSGRIARVLSVWIIRHGEHVPRLVTALPD